MEKYCGRGYEIDYETYIDFINYVFGFNGDGRNFPKLLPKLYRPELCPQGSNYVVTEDGKLRAAVGAFDSEISVCGETLRCRGIGNVAVHPFHRSKGYMKEIMNAAIDGMIADGIDFSALGGRRQRYNYFGFDRAGCNVNISINGDNIRHTFGNAQPRIRIVGVSADDRELLGKIGELSDSRIFHPIRPEGELFAILSSWEMKVFAAFDGEEFAGYCLLRDGQSVVELILKNPADARDFLLALWKHLGAGYLNVTLPEFYGDVIEELYRIGEGVGVSSNMTYLILNYRHVISAFFKLKESYTHLPDGRLTLLIHGRAGDERLEITVKDGKSQVLKTDKAADVELDHLTAINFLFAQVYPKRFSMPEFVRAWFPLPIWMYQADEV